MDAIGKRIPRIDAIQKAMGKAIYADDLNFGEMLYGKVLRSSMPHARIKHIDTTKAQKLKGVRAILLAKDIPGENRIGILGDPFRDQPVLAEDKVRFVGEPIALIAAESEEIAEKATKLIKVDYEELPAVFDPLEAMKADAPKLHKESNLVSSTKISKGNVQQGFENSDIIVEAEYRTPMNEHAYLEPEAGIAKMEGDEMIVMICTQAPSRCREEVATVLGLPHSKVRIIQTTMGGGFGGKHYNLLACQLALLALKTGKTVKMTLTREESISTTIKRHPCVAKYKWGCSKEGKILAAQIEIILNAGAYADHGPAVLTRAAVHAAGPYEIPNLKVDAHLVYTNTPPGGAMRGFGVPSVAFAHECHMEKLAERLGMDPIELRLKNAFDVGSKTHTGQILTKVALKKTLEQAKKIAEEWRKNGEKKESIKTGVGIATTWYGIGSTAPVPNPSGAVVEILYDGSVILRTNCAEVGQGSDTVLAQIVAEEIGVSCDRVRVHSKDSAAGPWCRNTCASAQTYIVGEAARLAARSAKEILLKQAGKILGVERNDLQIKNGIIHSKKDLKKKITIQDAAKECKKAGIVILGCSTYNPPLKGLNPIDGQGDPYAAYSYITQVAEVEVDTETGKVKPKKFASIADIGKVINPTLAEGQMDGGVSMGLGHALMEEVIINNGTVVTPTLSQYLIPTSTDMPEEMITTFLDDYEPTGPFGAKGLGELANVAVVPAVIAAIHDATKIWIEELPATSEKIYKLLQKKQPSRNEP
jgi:CO/xanthine dehydrogenase Mo-binding subunit